MLFGRGGGVGVSSPDVVLVFSSRHSNTSFMDFDPWMMETVT